MIILEIINDLYGKLIELMVIFMKDFINAKIINMEIHQDHFSLNNFSPNLNLFLFLNKVIE